MYFETIELRTASKYLLLVISLEKILNAAQSNINPFGKYLKDIEFETILDQLIDSLK